MINKHRKLTSPKIDTVDDIAFHNKTTLENPDDLFNDVSIEQIQSPRNVFTPRIDAPRNVFTPRAAFNPIEHITTPRQTFSPSP